MKRISLLVGTNFAVLMVLGVVMSLLQPFLIEQGININLFGALVFAAIFGMGGAFFSLMMSKGAAKRATRAQVIDQPQSQVERWLVSTVERQARQAGIGMPEVAIFPAAEPNAFATGASKNNSLVAVSAGLLQHMEPNEVEAVLAHEVAHIANGDMVTMTLLQGVLNTFVLFLAQMIGQLVDRVVFRSNSGRGIGYYFTFFVLQFVLGILASCIVMAFSRWREFRADAGAAELSGRKNMIAALERLKRGPEPAQMPDSVEAMGISGRAGGGIKRLLMSHPPLEERIEALRRGT